LAQRFDFKGSSREPDPEMPPSCTAYNNRQVTLPAELLFLLDRVHGVENTKVDESDDREDAANDRVERRVETVSGMLSLATRITSSEMSNVRMAAGSEPVALYWLLLAENFVHPRHTVENALAMVRVKANNLPKINAH
jgi:hypothetical protein